MFPRASPDADPGREAGAERDARQDRFPNAHGKMVAAVMAPATW
jgi:hypothetical protein